MTILHEIDQVVDVLKNMSDRGIKCNLLVGAGCSVTAGIPTASGIVDIIREKFPSIYNTVKDKTYANCMNALSPDERIDLIKGLVENSKLNITNIIISELLKRGFIHRILTPNFDNLLIKACSIVNEYPPIYDLAAYEEFQPEHIPEKCIFYLHGQFTGFKLMNTNKEVKKQADKLENLFRRLNERSVWIIVGYSGQNDALFKLLSQEPIYKNRLYWIGYNDQEPHEELRTQILKPKKYGFYIKGFDSDSFFWNLANKLGTFPPDFLLRPFTYIKTIIDQIVPYHLEQKADLNSVTNTIIQKAIDKYEKDPVLMGESYMKLGFYDKIIEMKEELLKKRKKVTVANAYFYKALKLHNEVEKNKSIEMYRQVIKLYEESNTLDPYHGCDNNIGNCFDDLADLENDKFNENLLESLSRYIIAIEKGGVQAYKNFKLSLEKYLEKHFKESELLEDVMEVDIEDDDPELIQKIYDWLNLLLSKNIKFNESKMEEYLYKYKSLLEEKQKQTA
ncbi:hypothetical protein SAMN05877753_103101 [Bacillus oleivorans]|uniref:Uncharacterized protein n=1 Tax=Bacillus oleivorans TaxID=1448271 RepID=A0A285CPU3_9BACI|nr:hypothetical protein [Bacillus oleivorans]SNX69534.1 hypothetical protein SAMN05877753_103101 [Bacillus oleivorans]